MPLYFADIDLIEIHSVTHETLRFQGRKYGDIGRYLPTFFWRLLPQLSGYTSQKIAIFVPYFLRRNMRTGDHEMGFAPFIKKSKQTRNIGLSALSSTDLMYCDLLCIYRRAYTLRGLVSVRMRRRRCNLSCEVASTFLLMTF